MSNETSSDRIDLFIAIPCYFVLLGIAAIWANRKNRRFQKADNDDTILSSHYLGGRDFGPLLLPGTMFAGWFSGYTIVGVPNEAFRSGWLALRWMAATLGVVVVLTAVSPRFQRVGQLRHHQSSVDFLTDRFQSQLVRYTAFVLQLVPSIIFLAGQCTAIRTTFNSIFGIDPDSVAALLVIAALIVVFECIGGLTSVALTDSIQASLMIICFIMLSSLIKGKYGGWSDLDWATYPAPEHYQTPSTETAWLFWSFVFGTAISIFTLPPFIQRIYAARSPRSVKAGLGLISMGPFCMMIPAVFVGTMSVQILADAGVESSSSPFAQMLEILMADGNFSKVVATITYTASLAAIMSTADSVLIGISHLVTVECIKPIMPGATPRRLKAIGSLTSVLAMAAGVCISIFGGNSISQLATIQFSLSMQIAPAFLIGLFATERYDCHPMSIFAGAVVGTIGTLSIHYGYMKEWRAGNIEGIPFDSGLGGLLANVGVILICEVLRRFTSKDTIDLKHENNNISQECELESTATIPGWYCRPAWEIPQTSRFGKEDEKLTCTLVWNMMEGIREPFCESWAWTILFLLLSVCMSPFGVGGVPPLTDDGMLAYAPGVIRGIPAWAMSIIIYSLATTVILLAIIWMYPDTFPSGDDMVRSCSVSSRGSSVEGSNENETSVKSSLVSQGTIDDVEAQMMVGVSSNEKEEQDHRAVSSC